NISGVYYEISGGGLSGTFSASENKTCYPEIDTTEKYAAIQLKLIGIPEMDTLIVQFKTALNIKVTDVELILYSATEGYLSRRMPPYALSGRDLYNNPNLSLLNVYQEATGIF